MLESLVSLESMSLSSMDVSVLERLKWLQQQQQVLSTTNASPELLQFHGTNNDELLQNTFSHFQMLRSGFGPNYSMGFGPSHEAMDGCISRTNSCQMDQADTVGVMLKNSEENITISLKNKRKSEVKTREEEKTEKKIKVEAETELNMKARREKISKKMKYLQDLVPGCNKVTGRAGMLDEIINYVQSLQRQVEFLSMKLAVLNPELELAMEDLSVKQFQAYFTNLPVVVASKPSLMVDAPLFPLDQQGSLDLSVINPNQATTIEAPSASWETQSQSLYNTSSLGFQY
ncbi:hypothetical protein IGI04_025852 [Brassica rapa subsp. trilocularis]|uniref:BHLH domain-containing protein n=1 Tax=Brassica rapa subsp. trilocularis TaxID=1813537 RepID=A0ABQ7KX17_BRACM|nr:hypothetical protein IGI04_025852 [Brassica rapa subsp. trilocularis]